ncbi:PAS domain S-box protein [Opitutus terrae]|uniref:histidine kinase n=1 Tax=Opitutus terrae (strain DSM 11246 / JCM 15787 / PB90-1) TaxID=452637 RepID=B1ZSW4_OPITP|nr:PAS domain S-box protein [Opitutus terrae]ACB75753.1 PAS/PAC sensor hybrid histidine kinase [Opitutus terrae PB90-1]
MNLHPLRDIKAFGASPKGGGCVRAGLAAALFAPVRSPAAEPVLAGFTGSGWWLAAALVVAAAVVTWLITKAIGRRTAGQAGQLKSLLEFANCLLWEARVELQGDALKWDVSLQSTALAQQLFGHLPPRPDEGLWDRFEVPEREEMEARCRTALRERRSHYEHQFSFVREGRPVWLRESVTVTPESGNRFHLVGLVTDVTRQRETELARRASEERVRQLLSRSDCMLWEARVRQDEAGAFHWDWFIPKSELYRRLVGEAGGPNRMPWDASIVPEYGEIEARAKSAMREGRDGYEQEFRVVANNSVLWMHEQVVVKALSPREWMLQGVVIDITVQRQAEESKRASEAQLQQVMGTADFLLWHARVFVGPDGRMQWVLNVPGSTLYRRLFGRDPQHPLALPWNQLVSADVYAQMDARSAHAIKTGAEGYEQEFPARRGSEEFWLREQATIRAVGPGEWQVVGIVTDATTRHLAEEARLASERALREILERAGCLLWRATVMRTEEGVRWTEFEMPASRLSTEIFGGRMPTRSDQLWDYAEVPDLAQMNVVSTRALLSGSQGYEQEFRAVQGDRLFWLHEQVAITKTGPDEWHAVGVVTDVTQRHLAQEAQRQSEVRLEELLRTADCLIWQGEVSLRSDGTLEWVLYVPRSRLFRRIFGHDPQGKVIRWDEVRVPELPEMQRTARMALSSGHPGYEQVFHVPKPNGDIWVTEQVTISPAGPQRWSVVGVITDITARREAEEARRTTEAQLQQILELADCMVWQATITEHEDGELDWKLFTPNSVLYRRLFGDGEGEPEMGWDRLDVPEHAEMHERATAAIRRRDPGYEQEFRVVLPQGVVWLREVVTVTGLDEHRFRLVGVITDITAQREAQEAYRASVAQVEQMLVAADCTLWQARVFEVAPRQLRWVMFVPRSRLYRELFGRDPSPPAGLPWTEVTDAATRAEIDRHATEAILGEQPAYEQEFRAQRGARAFWLHEQVSITPIGPGEWRLVGVMTDMTARREAEQAVRASELRYRTLFQHMPVAIIEIDFSEVGRWLASVRARGITDLSAWLRAHPRELLRPARLIRVLDCNDTAMDVLRATGPSDFRRRRMRLATPDMMELVRSAILCLWDERNTLEAEVEMRDFEGGLHEMNVRWWMELTEEGLDFRQSVLVLVDLTELKQAEAALAAEKERLAVTLRAMAEGVITTDVEGRVQFINDAAVSFTQWEASAAIGRPVQEVCLLENDRTGERVEMPVARVGRGDVVMDLPPRTRLVRRDGASRLVEGCCAPIHSAVSKVIGTVFVFRDVTEHERLEQELVRATKLESVGILAGGIAHDFNNILTAVMGNVALAGLDVDPESEAARSLREAEKATLRARDLTQQLLTFAKGGEPVRAAVQLGGTVHEIVTFTLHGSKVRAAYDIPDDLWPADVDKGQIGRVVQNLVLNAVQAMPEGGTVSIALRNERIEGYSQVALAPGDYVRIAIADTGVGIPPEHLPRIFDPYFSTKPMGSGLGLAAVYSIVNKHRGGIDVKSQVGKGSTFTIWLPASHDQAADESPNMPVTRTTVLKGRVLFMDDEEPIREMAVFLLRRLGMEVECAADGAEAVHKYEEARAAGNPFALVIMDLTVPGGMGGREAIGQLRALDPNVRAVVSSGYSSDPVLANYREHGFCGVVAKPYEVADLARVLRSVLGGSNGVAE